MDLPAYRERLLPRWWAWLLAGALVAMLAVAYGAALGPTVGVVVAIAAGLVAAWLLWISAPAVTVAATTLSAGGAVLPLSCVSGVEVVDGARIRTLRGPGADARLFVELRPWSASGGVLVTLDDDEDPHPAWLVSSRGPARLAEVIRARIASGPE